MTCLSRRLPAVLLLLVGLATIPGKASAETYATCAGFIDSLPATISTQGVWCVRKNLSTAITSGTAILIATNNVTIDCNDFKVGGLAGGEYSRTRGIQATDRQNVTVRHCNVRGFYAGVQLSGAGHLVEDSRFDNSSYTGIWVSGDNNLVQRNRVYDIGGRVLFADHAGIKASAHVIDNTVAGVSGPTANAKARGIEMTGDGNVARNNRVSGVQPTGTAEASGIRAYGRGTRIEGNQVVAPPGTNGTGIHGAAGHETVCNNNATSGFSTPMVACMDNWGSATL